MALRAAAAPLRISLFGQPRFTDGDAPFRLIARPKTLPLLAYLLLHRDRPTARDSLAFMLWEDATEEEARANLRRHLHQLQQALPAREKPWVLVDAETAQWNPESDFWLDVAEFERLIAIPDERARAIDIYAGDLLENLYDDWLFGPRERLRNACLAALNELVAQTRSARRLQKSTEYAQRILTIDPWREDAVRQMISLRYESGDRTGALREYERFVQALRKEMDVDPMPETVALRDAILRNAALRESPDSSDPDEHPRDHRGGLPFVGRAAELGQMRMLWSRAARGRGSVVFVSGEAGIGKTRLAVELAMFAEREGARVLYGTTHDPESAPYEALAEAFRGALPLLAASDVDPIWLAALAHLLPELRARRTSLPPLASADAERERARLFEAFALCLERLARVRPILLVLEDLHWAGEATMSAVRFIGRRAAHCAQLVVVTYRSDEAPASHRVRAARRELLHADFATSVPLGRLTLEDVEALAATLPDPGGRVDAPRLLYEHSEGHPLYLAQMARDLREQPQAATPWEQDLRGTILARVAHLSEASRTLAEFAAVGGPSFDSDVLREIGGWDEAEIASGLGELIDRYFVREIGGRRGLTYAFTHHLIHAAIYGQIPAEARVRRHRRVAGALVELTTDAETTNAAQIARHYDLGGLPASAAMWYARAARYTASLYAYDEAHALASRALELSDDAAVRIDALLTREAVRALRINPAGQREDLDELERFAHASEDGGLRCEVLTRRLVLARRQGERETEARLVGKLRREAEATGEARLIARAALDEATTFYLVNRFDEAHAAALRALELFGQIGDGSGTINSLCRLAEIAMFHDSIAAAQRYLASARVAADQQRNPALVAETLHVASMQMVRQHQFERAAEVAREAAALFRSIGDLEGEARSLARCSTGLARLSRWGDARRCNLAAGEIFESTGNRQGAATCLVNRSALAVRLGDLDEARRTLEEARTHFEALHDERGVAICTLNLSANALWRGEPAKAAQLARDALWRARSVHEPAAAPQALANLGAAERELGKHADAIRHLQAATEQNRRLNRPGDLADSLTDLALAYLSNGDLAAARDVTDELLAAPDSTDAAVFAPYPTWVAARVMRAVGERRSRSLLERAHAQVEAMLETIDDGAARERFSALWFVREIVAALERDEWPV